MKVIFHIDECERWKVAISNVKNTLKWAEENKEPIEIEVLANSEAVLYLVATQAEEVELKNDLLSFLKQGVVINACANALRANDIVADKLLEGVGVVPAGIIELIQKQNDGFAYIRP